MEKSFLLTCSFMLFSCMAVNNLAFAAAPTSINVKRFGEDIYLTLKKIKCDGQNRYEIYGNGYCIAQPFQASNLLAFQVFFDADRYCHKIHNSHSKEWHKNIIHYNSESDNSDTLIETLATKDTIIELNIINGFTNMSYLKTTNPKVIKEATGYNLIGMSPDEIEVVFGNYQIQVENKTPFIVYSFYLDGGSMNEMKFGLDDGRIREVEISNDAPGECNQKIGERVYYEGELPEGWFTRGTITATNLNVRKEPKSGEVIVKIGAEHPDIMFAETRDTGEEYKWVKIITKLDKSKKYVNPVQGWVYGKYISPSFKTFNYRDGLLNSFDYFRWLPNVIGKPTSISKEKTKNNAQKLTKVWKNKGLTLKMLSESGETNLIYGELTSDSFTFAGLKVGNSIDKLKEFNKNLNKSGFILANGCKIENNRKIKWLDKDRQKKDSDNYEIEIETKANKISKISFHK